MNARLHTFYVLIITALVVVIFFLFRANEDAARENRAKDDIIEEKDATIAYHKNALGREIAEKKAVALELDDLKKAYPKLLADVTTNLEIKYKNILGIVQGSIQAHGEGTVKIIRDTIKVNQSVPLDGATATIEDGYLNMSGTIRSDVVDYFDYKYDYLDTLILGFERKKSFFKGEEITISGSLSNKHARLTSVTGVLVHKIKPKRFNVSVGVYYDPLRQQYGPAVTAGYSIIRF